MLAFVCMMGVVQTVGAQDYFSSASDFARIYVGAVEPQYQTSLWYDLPYYNGTNMYKGRISYYGVVYDDVQLRFDMLKQRVVVLSPVGSVFCLPEQEYVDWFEMDGHRFVHDPEDSLRYAALLCDGSTNGVRLYHSMWKIYSGENTFGGMTPLKVLSNREHYTLITPDGVMHRVKRASDVAKLFPEQKKQIKQFARTNRLSFSKIERELSLAKVTGSISGTPLPQPSKEVHATSPLDSEPTTLAKPIDEEKLLSGIPVLDIDSVSSSVAPSKTKVYIVPGVKKARASIADDQELAEIIVVGGRQSAVNNMMIGSEKFKPEILKNIPSAFGESDIMNSRCLVLLPLERLQAAIMYEEVPQIRTSSCLMEVRCIIRLTCSDCSRRSILMR